MASFLRSSIANKVLNERYRLVEHDKSVSSD